MLTISCFHLQAQKIDNIFFNLYTDSLKKGTYNYINVDGKFSNGTWLPLTTKHLKFSTSNGRFEGNSLLIDKNCKEDKVTVSATLLSDSAVSKSITIYIKKKEDNEKLKTSEEVLREIEKQGKQKRKS